MDPHLSATFLGIEIISLLYEPLYILQTETCDGLEDFIIPFEFPFHDIPYDYQIIEGWTYSLAQVGLVQHIFKVRVLFQVRYIEKWLICISSEKWYTV